MIGFLAMGIETPLASYDLGGFILPFDVSVDIFHGNLQWYFTTVKVSLVTTPNIRSFISWISAVSACRRPLRETDEETAENQAGSFKA